MRLDGQKLRRLRENQGLTLVQLAKLAQLSKSQVSFLERNERGATPPTAARLAQALGVAIADLRRDTTPAAERGSCRPEDSSLP